MYNMKLVEHIKSCSLRPPLQERKFNGGSGQISEGMARELGDRVKLQSPVYRIDQSGDVVEVETLAKQTYTVCHGKGTAVCPFCAILISRFLKILHTLFF